MKPRAISNEDLKVTKGWLDQRGYQRVAVSLKGLSFVNKVFWLKPNVLDRPETLARVKADLQQLLAVKTNCLRAYLES